MRLREATTKTEQTVSADQAPTSVRNVGFRDRFLTPTTAKAILSWRIGLGVGIAVVTAVLGLPIGLAVALGAGIYVGTVLAAMPKAPERPAIDPFVLSEPWRKLMQDAQGSGRKLRRTVDGMDEGALKDSLQSIARQLDHGLDEAWKIAKRGDEIDDIVRNLEPTRLRSRLATLQTQATAAPGPETTAAIASVENQLATADRLGERSAETATTLRHTQIQLDELVARASEVRAGAADTASYAHDVDDLVVRLEALHQAVEETRPT